MVRFLNTSRVPNDWLQRIIDSAQWPAQQHLRLFVGGESRVQESGRIVWFGHRAQSRGDRGLWGQQHWAFAIYVTDRTTNLYGSSPAYVAWILAHELAHGFLTLQNPELASILLFVQDHIKRASGGAVKDWHQLPHELACDQFARWVAERFLGADAFQSQMGRLKDSPGVPMEPARLELMLGTAVTNDLSAVLERMREFVAPYADELEQLWLDDQRLKGKASYVFALDPSWLRASPHHGPAAV